MACYNRAIYRTDVPLSERQCYKVAGVVLRRFVVSSASWSAISGRCVPTTDKMESLSGICNISMNVDVWIMSKF